ncbi:asparagine synthase [Escherichia coli]|nr:asparagine synthase [Escherichia coli]
MVSYFYPSLKSSHSIKPVKNYRSINKYATTPYPFSQISNHHYVFLFFHRQIACAQCCFAAFF